MSGWIGDDPNPTYSRLDNMDGLYDPPVRAVTVTQPTGLPQQRSWPIAGFLAAVSLLAVLGAIFAGFLVVAKFTGVFS